MGRTEILLKHVVLFNVIQNTFMEIGWAYLFTLLISCNSDEETDFTGPLVKQTLNPSHIEGFHKDMTSNQKTPEICETFSVASTWYARGGGG